MVLTINERSDIFAIAQKYIITHIGINFRVGLANYLPDLEQYHITLHYITDKNIIKNAGLLILDKNKNYVKNTIDTELINSKSSNINQPIKFEDIYTENTFDSYIDLLVFNHFDSKQTPTIVLYDDIYVLFSEETRVFSAQERICNRNFFITKTKESYIIEKDVIGIGYDNLLSFYFIGIDEYKRLNKQEVFFDFFFWIVRLSKAEISNSGHTLSFSNIFREACRPSTRIKAGMKLMRKGTGIVLKKFDLDKLILKFKKLQNNSKMHQ